jgi:hypothetical protein
VKVNIQEELLSDVVGLAWVILHTYQKNIAKKGSLLAANCDIKIEETATLTPQIAAWKKL